jgi:RNA-directed DNA polymerase
MASPAASGSAGSIPVDLVRALQHALYRAAKADPGRKFHALHDKIIRSDVLWRAWVVVRRNNGAPGVDKITLAQVEEYGVARLLGELASELREKRYRPLPARRVLIPKPGMDEMRPLSIPVLMDRCHQARVRNALEPEWEARFEPRSYGFRPGRGCHDAIEAIYSVCKGPGSKRAWILDADLAAAFDKIDHSRLLQALGSFPARDLIRGWLKAGAFEAGKGFAPTEEGTPQGGLCSASHNDPYAQCWLMRSADPSWLVRAGLTSGHCA